MMTLWVAANAVGKKFLAILVVCTLGGWAPLFERSWVQFLVSLAK